MQKLHLKSCQEKGEGKVGFSAITLYKFFFTCCLFWYIFAAFSIDELSIKFCFLHPHFNFEVKRTQNGSKKEKPFKNVSQI
jgi:hypothetical protein